MKKVEILKQIEEVKSQLKEVSAQFWESYDEHDMWVNRGHEFVLEEKLAKLREKLA